MSVQHRTPQVADRGPTRRHLTFSTPLTVSLVAVLAVAIAAATSAEPVVGSGVTGRLSHARLTRDGIVAYGPVPLGSTWDGPWRGGHGSPAQ